MGTGFQMTFFFSIGSQPHTHISLPSTASAPLTCWWCPSRAISKGYWIPSGRWQSKRVLHMGHALSMNPVLPLQSWVVLVGFCMGFFPSCWFWTFTTGEFGHHLSISIFNMIPSILYIVLKPVVMLVGLHIIAGFPAVFYFVFAVTWSFQ